MVTPEQEGQFNALWISGPYSLTHGYQNRVRCFDPHSVAPCPLETRKESEKAHRRGVGDGADWCGAKRGKHKERVYWLP